MTDTKTTTRAKPVDPARRARLKALRVALGLTQEKLAERCGIRREKMCKIESGLDKASTVETRDALAMGLGLSSMALEDMLSGRVEVPVMAKRIARAMARAAAAGEGVAK